MSLNYNQLDNRLANLLRNDDVQGTSERLILLNQGQKRIVHDAPYALGPAEATISVTVAAGRQYTLEPDFYQLVRMWHAARTDPLEVMSHEEWMLWEAQTTIPSASPAAFFPLDYDKSTADKWTISFDYTPDDSYTVNYIYWWMPADITGSELGPIVSRGFEDLLLWAAAMLGREPHDPQGAAEAEGYYQRELEKYKRAAPFRPAERSVPQAGMVRDPRSLLPWNYPTFRW